MLFRSSRALGKHDSKNSATALNFGGQATELYCVGGEVAFIEQMVSESQHFASNAYGSVL